MTHSTIYGTDDVDDLISLSHKVAPYVVGYEGNVSKKNGDVFFIKASGTRLSEVDKKCFVKYDFELNQLNNLNHRGSMELDFHAFLLSFSQINYVCHTHPTQTMKILCSDKIIDFAEKRLFPDQVVFNGPMSCVIPYTKPGNLLKKVIEKKILSWVQKYDELPKLILLANHGIITVGRTPNECLLKTEICEKSASIFLGSHFSQVNFLKRKHIEELIKDDNEKYRIKNL